MKILAIETSTAICAAAFISNSTVIAEQSRNEPQVHSEQLLTLVDAVLSSYDSSNKPVDAVAVSIGPGSFTGLRIGLSVAKGLCFAWDTPIIAVPTLTALAWNCKQYSIGNSGDYILSMIDARRNEAYAALFRIQDGDTLESPPERGKGVLSLQQRNIVEVYPAQAVTLETCVTWAQQHHCTIILGDATEKFLHCIEQQSEPGPALLVPQKEHSVPCAASVGLLGEQLLAKGVTANVSSLEPYYIKEFVTVAQPQIMVNQHGMV